MPKVATAENKFGKVLIAHGVNLAEGESDTDKIIGTLAKVMVEDYNFDEEGKSKVASSITKVKPRA